ncbi:MAG: hypothetical protein AB7G88_03365 [Thermomicrobiales bacterium]
MTAPHLLEMTHTNFAGVHFAIRSGTGNDVRLSGWSQPNIAPTRHIPGSDRSITFQMGRGPMVLSYSAEFQDRADYAAIQALIGTTGILQVPRRVCELAQTPAVDGVRSVEEVNYFGRIYTRVTEIILMDVGQPLAGDGEYIETTLRFHRNERPE